VRITEVNDILSDSLLCTLQFLRMVVGGRKKGNCEPESMIVR
jgi:hypothetical protein